jgi:hypothetical protein
MGDSNLLQKKVLFFNKTGAKMSNLPVDRDTNYMRDMWGTTSLITDYEKPRTIQEIMHDDIPLRKHHLKEQSELHQKIRNDEDYDDWEYGTEPNYGSSWKST